MATYVRRAHVCIGFEEGPKVKRITSRGGLLVRGFFQNAKSAGYDWMRVAKQPSKRMILLGSMRTTLCLPVAGARAAAEDTA